MKELIYNLLSRDDFRKNVFERDDNSCIICHQPAVDAHHIIERRLWIDKLEFGGYFICNGASLCEEHHKLAEINAFPPQYLWKILGIYNPVKPKSFNKDIDYDKWGIPFKMPNRYRIKYPTTPYLPFSPQWKSSSNDNDDNAYLENVDNFINVPLIITIKLDGSNVQLTKDIVAARNGNVANHKSFDYLKSLHAQEYSSKIPEGIEVFGEWLYAKHSIHYDNKLCLDSYLQLFGIYDMNKRMWGSWTDVENMAKRLNVPTVPVIKPAIYNHPWQLVSEITNIATNVIKQGHEGTVVRIIYPFHYGQFGTHIAKYVRPNHVQTDTHWTKQDIVKNMLRL